MKPLLNKKGEETMKKVYESPTISLLSLVATEDILTASEESFDINVSFDELWGSNL